MSIERTLIRQTYTSNIPKMNNLVSEVNVFLNFFNVNILRLCLSDDTILKRMLYMNKYNLEKTKNKLEMYYVSKNMFPEQFENNHSLHPEMQLVATYAIFVPLPHMTADYGRVTISKLIEYDNRDYNLEQFLKYIFSIYEVRLFYDCHLHEQLIIDLSNASFRNIFSTTPSTVIKALTILQKGYSDRIKGIHLLHAPSYASSLITIMKRIFKKKMVNRIFAHNNLNSLHKYIAKEILPEDYGGNERPVMELHANWQRFMENNNEFLIRRQSFKSKENFSGVKQVNSRIFGNKGSFRQPEID